MTMTTHRLLVLVLASGLVGCGTTDGDPGTIAEDLCGFGSERYLPYQPGFTWTYQITDVGSGQRKIKEQHLEGEVEHPDFGRVIVQITGKLAGSTRSLLRVDGERVVRFLQEDRDAGGAVERTTTYDPGQIRIDESRLDVGATWTESYQETQAEPAGAPVVSTTTDRWEVIGLDVPCRSPAGTFECLHLRRSRVEGGVAVKEFLFARGVGKIRESGDSQIEELAACGR
jgi:hypothetical protein